MIFRWTSAKPVIAKLYRDLNLQDESRLIDITEWIFESMEFIGSFNQLITETKDLTVTNHQAPLPCNFYQMIQIMYNGAPLQHTTDSFTNSLICCGQQDETSTDPITQGKLDDLATSSTGTQGPCLGTYSLLPSWIRTSFKEGNICISYTAVPIDEDNLPLIPDDVSFKQAVVDYVTMMLYHPEWIAGRIPDNRYKDLVASWEHRCMQARGHANMPSLDQMEAIKNMWVRLLPTINQHSNFFKDLGRQEALNI